ncbi:MAG TPA: hypothetical protein VN089_23485 [Duganella sp.]|nr:hypothetical protein [Duganella sp.]
MRFQVSAAGLVCATLLAACGGGGGGSGGGAVQSISFPFPGGETIAVPPAIQTVALKATASSGGPVTYESNTPTTCSVSGSTLSLLKVGECAVTATQAGFEGYAPASNRQLFVIPKSPQAIQFRNPGAQPLDSTPLTLLAIASSGGAVAFTSTTPSTCTVSGNTLTKVANGICSITARQDGTDVYASALEVVKNIPIGTEKAPALTFLSGYKDTSNTNEGGAVNYGSGNSLDGGWCAGAPLCGWAVSSDGSSFSYFYNIQLVPPAKLDWVYSGISMLASGLKSLSETGPTTSGVRIDAQAAMKFNFTQNAEWLGTSDNALNVDLVLGHYAVKGDKGCNVTLRAVVKPTTAEATDYSLGLRDKFTVSESCGLAGLDPWNELQDFPISKIGFSPSTPNSSVGTTLAGKPTYTTKYTLTGPITFQ